MVHPVHDSFMPTDIPSHVRLGRTGHKERTRCWRGLDEVERTMTDEIGLARGSAGTRTVGDAVLPSLSIGDLPDSGGIVMICLSAFQNDSWITNG